MAAHVFTLCLHRHASNQYLTSPVQDAEAWAVRGMEASSSTAEITTLQQLEQVVQQAGSQIVVVAFYSRVSFHQYQWIKVPGIALLPCIFLPHDVGCSTGGFYGWVSSYVNHRSK